MSQRSHALVLGAMMLTLASVGVAAIVRNTMPPLPGVLTYFICYWTGCIALGGFLAPGSSIRVLYRPVAGHTLVRSLGWAPAVATFALAFLPSVRQLSFGAIAAIALFSLANGMFEEFFWRGAFVVAFPAPWPFGLPASCALFTLAHVPLLLLSGIQMQGGPAALLSGAAVLGAIWGWLAWAYHDLKSVSAAHVSTNFFAFCGLVAQNWSATSAA